MVVGEGSNDPLDGEMNIYEKACMPRKRQTQLRRRLVQTLLTEDMWRKAQKVAGVQGHTMSAWLRRLVTLAVNPSSPS
jgi:hypothetical protein